MAGRYDVECLLGDVEEVLTTKLNSKIAQINAEKNDSISMATIPVAGYFLQTMNEKMANYDPFVYYGVGNIEPGDEMMPGRSSDIVDIEALICVIDPGQDDTIAKRMFRYGRALKEVFETNFNAFDGGNIKATIISKMPIDIGILNDSFTHKAVGVIIRASIG